MKFNDEIIHKEVHSGPLGAQLLSDGSYVIEDLNWFQLVSPNRLDASRNEVIVSELSPDTAKQKIDEVIQFYKELGTSFKWVVTPYTKPINFGELLRKKGFRSWYGRGMYCFPEQLEIIAPGDINIARVNENNLETFVDLAIKGWGLSTNLKKYLLKDYHWALNHKDKKFYYYIAKLGDEPAGTAGFIQKERSGYLIGGNVLEPYQGKGIYKALIKARLDDITDLGIKLATSGTREKTSAPILEKMGFKTAYRDEIFQYDLEAQK